MVQEIERDCPNCETTREFYLGASTELHLGKKTKWLCPECDHAFVRIDGDIDSSGTA